MCARRRKKLLIFGNKLYFHYNTAWICNGDNGLNIPACIFLCFTSWASSPGIWGVLTVDFATTLLPTVACHRVSPLSPLPPSASSFSHRWDGFAASHHQRFATLRTNRKRFLAQVIQTYSKKTMPGYLDAQCYNLYNFKPKLSLVDAKTKCLILILLASFSLIMIL